MFSWQAGSDVTPSAHAYGAELAGYPRWFHVSPFGAGKSSVINALLGSKVLAEGVLPTTNEITVLRYGGEEARGDRQQADGFVERYIDAELLKELNIVDTPGTNVILERQQRLTEEYVPRADLVLFVMSMDRPFTESEVRSHTGSCSAPY
jgi:predicted GTPase